MEAESRALESNPLDAGIGSAPATRRPASQPSRASVLAVARDYLALTKPRIIALLLVLSLIHI